MTEETIIKHQIKDYLALKGIFNYHLLAGMGAYKGCPDRVMHYKNKVVYLEIKKQKGKLSENQIIFQEQCKKDKVDYLVIRNLDELIRYLTIK